MHASTQIIAALSESLRRNAATLASASVRAKRGEVRGIHRLRVASRRLREATPAAAAVAGTDGARLVRDLRRVTRGLGMVRELDVSRDVLAKFAERERWPTAIVAEVDDFCERARRRAFDDARDVLESLDARDARRRLRAIADAIDEQGMKAGGRAVWSARLRECGRTLISEIDEAGTLYAPQPLHRVRIAVKKLRYVIELAGESIPGSLRRLKKIQSALGRMHDAQVLQSRIDEMAAQTGDRGLVATLTTMNRSIEAACRQWHAQVLKNLPGLSQLTAAIVASVPSTIGPRQIGRQTRMRAIATASARGRGKKKIA
jgi:CHAD domain-containing protein